ncbi:MAG: DUF423 domain-containing protein [Hyphomonadaceae bacterium]|nr:DUF423 domain-containing protein [Hyphomonadaceae bacterium]
MRLINAAAAMSGLVALAMLVAAAHPLRDVVQAADLDRIKLGALVQLGAACAGLAIANRSGRLNVAAGAMILSGAAIFAGTLYAISLTQSQDFAMLAPLGGITLISGWAVLAFAKPRA